MAYNKKDPMEKALKKKPELTNYKIVTVVSFTQVGNSDTWRRDDHREELDALFLDGWYPMGNPFVDPIDKRTIYQAFIR